jgi:PAS domain S-box-containing protein
VIQQRRLWPIAGLLATVILIAAAVQVLWSSFARSKDADQWVEHTYHVLISCERLLSTIREAESAVRGYVITRNRNLLAPYQADLDTQARILADLDALTRDSPEQQASLKAIRDLTAQRLAVLVAFLEQMDAGRIDIANGVGLGSGRGIQIMSDLTARVREFEDQEHQLLAGRESAAADAVSRTRFMLVFTSSGLALLLLLASGGVRRYIRNRELAYEALQHQAELVNFSHDAIITVNPAGVITGWNAGAQEIYGRKSDQALGRRIPEILHTKEADAAERIEAALRSAGHWDGELTQTTGDGRTCIVESRWVRVLNRAGEPIGAMNISRDETQRKQTEEALRQVAEQRRLALDAAELGSWDYRVADDRVIWDERCREIMALPGLGPASFEQVLKMVHPEEREQMRQAANWAMSAAGDGRFRQEMRIALRDGSVRWLATHGRVYFEEANGVRRPVRVIGVNSDITARKHAEEALRESEDRLRVALDAGRIGIFNDLPLEDRIVLDERAKNLVGLAPDEEVTPRQFLERIHPEDREKLRATRINDLRGQQSDPGEVDYRIVCPDGSIRWVIARRRIYFEGEGERRRAVRVMGIFLDMTRQKRSEQELAEALRQSERLIEQKDILFREVQHRVKNNLQVVSSLLSLEAQRFPDREFQKALNESRDRVRSMALMHEKFSHLDDLRRIEFSEYVEELARYFFGSYIPDPSAISLATNVDVKLSMDEAIPCGLILQELLSNSVKHAFPAGRGEIRIDFHLKGDQFELRYRDSGIGLPERVNLENPESLGLQLVSDLAAQLRGTVRYEFREGALFTLTFGEAS